MNTSNNKDIWILAEKQTDIINPAFYEIIGNATLIAEKFGSNTRVCAVAMGNNIDADMNILTKSGVDVVYGIEHNKLETYHPDYYATAFQELIDEYHPEIVLIPATVIGSEIAPTIAARLKTGLAAHCVNIYADDTKRLVQIVPAFGGKVLGEIFTPDARPIMATVKPGLLKIEQKDAKENVVKIKKNSTRLNCYDSPIRCTQKIPKATIENSLEAAEVVLCGGLGLQTLANWKKLDKIASAVGAAVGYTRPVVDMNWVTDESNMIGTSNKTIHPKIYVGFGVSGASHHMCGMKDSDVIISVNNDNNADCFNFSDYKICSDCTPILDAILKSFQN